LDLLGNKKISENTWENKLTKPFLSWTSKEYRALINVTKNKDL